MTFAEHCCRLRHAGSCVFRSGRLQQTIMINLATTSLCRTGEVFPSRHDIAYTIGGRTL